MKKILCIVLSCLFISGYACSFPAEDVYKLTTREYFPEVKKLLGKAKKSVYVSMYLVLYHLDHPDSLPNQLLQELVRAEERGVEVRVILDQGMIYKSRRYSNDPAYFFLSNAGIRADYDLPSTKLHEKLIIIDECITIIGSHNWSKSAFQRNRESSVVIKCPELAREFIEWFESTPLSPPHVISPQAKIPGLYVPYQFLTDPELGIKLSDMRMKFYLYLLQKWQENGYKTVFLDYDEAAKFVGVDKHSRKEYRTYLNMLLRVFSRGFGLVSFKVAYNKPAEIDLLDYKDREKPLEPDKRYCFVIPGAFFEFGWVQRLSVIAKYFYFINLLETDLTADPEGWWSHSRKYLRKKYDFTSYQLTQGSLELNRYNILQVKYGPLEYPFEENLKAPKYHLLDLYSWDWFQKELGQLRGLYGKEKVARVRRWAEVVLEENNLDTVEKLINYSNEYGEGIVQYAVDKVAEKRIGNPKRSFAYIEGIILKETGRLQEKSAD